VSPPDEPLGCATQPDSFVKALAARFTAFGATFFAVVCFAADFFDATFFFIA